MILIILLESLTLTCHLARKKVGRYFTSLSPPHADGAVDTFAGRSSALPVILRHCKDSKYFQYIVLH